MNRLKGEELGRIEYAERLAVAGPDERRQLRRGERIAQAVAAGGDLRGFSPEARRAFFDFARGVGRVPLAGLGGLNGDELRVAALRRSFPGVAVLPPDKADRKVALEDEGQRRRDDAAAAAELLAKAQGEAQADFLQKLNALQSAFVTDLRAGVLALVQTQQADRLAVAQADLGKLQALQKETAPLVAAGVTTPAQLKTLGAGRADLEAYASSLAALSRLDKGAAAARDIDAEALFRQASKDTPEGQKAFPLFAARLSDKLTGAGFTEAQAAEVAARLVNRDPSKFGRLNVAVPAFAARVADEARPALSQAVLDRRDKIVGPGSNVPVGVQRGLLGADPEAYVKGLFDAIDAANRAGVAPSELGAKLEEAGRKVDGFTRALAEATARLGPLPVPVEAVGKARGGPILAAFTPKGSDVVPAMLSEGEYVVNAAQTRANRGLLDRINKGSGPVYLADGGPVGRKLVMESAGSKVYRQPGRFGTGDKYVLVDSLGREYVYQDNPLHPDAFARPGRGRQRSSREFIPFDDNADNLPRLLDAMRNGFGPAYARMLSGKDAKVGEATNPYLLFDRKRAFDEFAAGQAAIARENQETARYAAGRTAERQLYRAAGLLGRDGRPIDPSRLQAQINRLGTFAFDFEAAPGSTVRSTDDDRLRLEAAKERLSVLTDFALQKNRDVLIGLGADSFRDRTSLFNRAGLFGAGLSDSEILGLGRPGLSAQRAVELAAIEAGGEAFSRRSAEELGAKAPDLFRRAGFRENPGAGRVLGFSAGGPVPGVGSGDSVAAALTPQEFVWNRSAALAVGHGRLMQAQRLASGGQVRAAASALVGSPGVGDSTASDPAAFAKAASEFTAAGASFGGHVATFVSGVDRFGQLVAEFRQAMNGRIRVDGEQTVTVNLTGYRQDQVTDSLKEFVAESVRRQHQSYFPGAG